MIKIVIVDDHAILRRGLTQIITECGDMKVVGEAETSAQALRLIRDNGVTYTANAEAGVDRPWTLDPVPVVLDQEDWRTLARGVAQRAKLMDAVLGDAYGHQRLLREGLIHPASLLSHPQFLRPLHRLYTHSPCHRSHLRQRYSAAHF
jgi:uncharacterized circularly permuted ATP-grasp superfamily protein